MKKKLKIQKYKIKLKMSHRNQIKPGKNKHIKIYHTNFIGQYRIKYG